MEFSGNIANKRKGAVNERGERKNSLRQITFWSFEAEACEVVWTSLLPDMLVPTGAPVFTETLSIPETVCLEFFGFLVQEDTIRITALSILDIEMAERHLAEVQDVKEFTIITL